MRSKKITLYIIFIIVMIIVASFISIKIARLSLLIKGDTDYKKLGLYFNSPDIASYTVYNQDIFSEYKVYKINDYYKGEHVNEIKEKLEKSNNWNKEKFYEYIMMMFYDNTGGKTNKIDRENLYFYHKQEIYAIMDLKNLKLYYYRGIPYYHKNYNKILEIKTQNYIDREIYSVRGGLQYDGIDYYVYKFDEQDNKEICEDLKNSNYWSKEKLNNNILDCFKYNSEIQSIQNAYYHYQKVCRTSDKYKKEHFTDEEATGYEVGIYDCDEHILYYYWESI